MLRFSYGKKSVVQKLKNVEIIDKIKVVDVDYVQDLWLSEAYHQNYFDLIIWPEDIGPL